MLPDPMTIVTQALVCLLLTGGVLASDCEPGVNERVTDHFAFSAKAEDGAVGDVVAVEIRLTVDTVELVLDDIPVSLDGFTAIGCFDIEVVELLDTVRYSDSFQELCFFSAFYSFGGDITPGGQNAQGVWKLVGNFKHDRIAEFLGPEQQFPLMTLFFRVRGDPGQAASLQFCDGVPTGRGCSSNFLLYSARDSTGSRFFDTRSTKHENGLVEVLDGDATHPAPPQLPPNAKVYPDAPTRETAGGIFELEGPAIIHAGASSIPFNLYVTSNYEFCGFMSSLRFPSEYLRLTHVDEHTRPGVLAIDNDSGGFGLFMSNSSQRVGQEGERVHLATLHFDVLEAAAEASEIALRFEDYGNYFNWLAIRHREGLLADDLPYTAEVPPLVLAQALLGVQTDPAALGDVNFDGELDLTDAVVLLQRLFKGGDLPCPGAADFNGDSAVNVSDPIAILNGLFRGGPVPSDRVFCW